LCLLYRDSFFFFCFDEFGFFGSLLNLFVNFVFSLFGDFKSICLKNGGN